MRIKFEVVEGQLCRIIRADDIECATYYSLGELHDLETFLNVIENAKTFMTRYGAIPDAYV